MAPPLEEKDVLEVVVEMDLDLEYINATLKALMHSSMLMYFTKRALPMTLVKNCTKSQL